MTNQAHDKIAAGLTEALAIARGEARPAPVRGPTLRAGTPSLASLWTLGAAVAEIERLRRALGRLACLDVTAREGQRAFAEWRNAYVGTPKTRGAPRR